MLVPNDIYDQIGDIIERAYTDFTYKLLGREFLTPEQVTKVEALGLLVGRRPLLELIYLLVKQRSEERYQSDRTLRELLAEIFATGVLPKLPETAQFTIDSAMESVNQIIQQTKVDVATSIANEVKKYNREEQAYQRQNIAVVPPVEIREKRDEKQSGLLLSAIGVGLLAVNRKFHREFTGELTTLVNHAAVDVAFELHGEAATEQLCYKRVMNDSRTCFHCHAKYLNPDGTPKIYKLGDLVANGSNYGKDKATWLPVVENDHPRCRCQLVLLNN